MQFKYFKNKHKIMGFKEIVISAALKAGEIVKEHYNQNVSFSTKDEESRDYVTKADLASEKIIIAELKSQYSHNNFISEESDVINNNSDYTWIIDPLDGTTNFLRKIPFFSISIALAKADKIILGCVYNPINNELFFAEKGTGAYLNNRKITVSSNNILSKSIVSQSFDYATEERKDNFKNIQALFFYTEGFRIFHSTALELCNVACGRTDAHMVSGANSWDVAAGAFIVEEAGGRVTQFDGSQWNFKIPRIIVTNSAIHSELIRKLL